MKEPALPEYSVLMSVYKNDKAEHFDFAIESMTKQTVKPHDIVVVCDGPLTPDLNTCLEKWQKNLGGLIDVVRLSENHGLGYALNVGLPKCGCNIVARMDSDDISRPERCELLLTKMVSENLDLVGGAIEEFEYEPGDMGVVRMTPLVKRDINKWLKERNPFNHMSVVFDRRAVERAGGYEPFPWMEDYWLWVRMIIQDCNYANIPDVVVDVRTGEGMYARRSNWAYFKSQVRFFSELRRLGLINYVEQIRTIVERALVTLLPTDMVKFIYNTFLRTKVNNCHER